MSYFGTTLARMMDSQNISGAALARAAKLTQPEISRYRLGEQVWVSADKLAAIAGVVCRSRAEKAELIRAHLLDECSGEGSDLIDIRILGDRLKETSTPYKVKLPDELEHAVEVIRANLIRDRDLKDIIIGLANLIEKGTLQE